MVVQELGDVCRAQQSPGSPPRPTTVRWAVAPKDKTTGTVTVTLFRERAFAGITEGLKMMSSWVIRGTPIQ